MEAVITIQLVILIAGFVWFNLSLREQRKQHEDMAESAKRMADSVKAAGLAMERRLADGTASGYHPYEEDD